MSPRLLDPSIARIAESAAACSDLGAVATTVRSCVACPEIAGTRTTVVVGDTPAHPSLLIVGEAPGASEDLIGRPFIGRGGQLLDDLLGESGISRADCAVLNVLKCRPPSNRTPTRREAVRCSGWLDRQVALLDPPLVLALGRTALTWALGAATTLESARGRVHEWRGRRLIASYHPSAALRFGPRGGPRIALEADVQFVAETLQCQ